LRNFLNSGHSLVEDLSEIAWQEIDLAYEVIPRDIGDDVNGGGRPSVP